MKWLLSTLAAGLVLAGAGQAAAAGPVAQVGLGAGLGCEAQCIEQATVVAGPFVAVLNVDTDTPARIRVKVSDQAPLQAVGGPHFYTWDAADSTGGAYWTHWSSALHGLEPGTLYHIVVWATDANGHTAYRQGTFRTKERRVEVTFWKVKVLNDADHDCCVTPNKGEITFEGEVSDQLAWSTPQKKLASGASFRPHPADEPFVVEDAPRHLELWVGGSECDRVGWNCIFESGSYCAANSDCASVAVTLDLDLLGNASLPGTFGSDMPAGHDGYVVFETDPASYLEFRVYAYVDVSYV